MGILHNVLSHCPETKQQFRELDAVKVGVLHIWKCKQSCSAVTVVAVTKYGINCRRSVVVRCNRSQHWVELKVLLKFF